jgi:hypothetical protein
MICQLCTRSPATRSIVDPAAGDGLAHYCESCLRARQGDPSTVPRGLPRAQFRLRDGLNLVARFAIVNALVVWVMRSGIIPVPPARVPMWTASALLWVNLFLTSLTVADAWRGWLQDLVWHKWTGGVLPRRERKTFTIREELSAVLAVLPVLGWCVVASLLERWLTRTVWHARGSNPLLFGALVFAPLLLLVAARLIRDRSAVDRLFGRVAMEWRTASRAERAWRCIWALAVAGLFLLAILTPGRIVHLIAVIWNHGPWFSIGVLLLVTLMIQLILWGGLALTVRRR